MLLMRCRGGNFTNLELSLVVYTSHDSVIMLSLFAVPGGGQVVKVPIETTLNDCGARAMARMAVVAVPHGVSPNLY